MCLPHHASKGGKEGVHVRVLQRPREDLDAQLALFHELLLCTWLYIRNCHGWHLQSQARVGHVGCAAEAAACMLDTATIM